MSLWFQLKDYFKSAFKAAILEGTAELTADAPAADQAVKLIQAQAEPVAAIEAAPSANGKKKRETAHA